MGITVEDFLINLYQSRLFTGEEAQQLNEQWRAKQPDRTAEDFADYLKATDRLTQYQASELLSGNTKGLVIGEYAVLYLVGSGGMGRVFKALHRHLHREVAIKVLVDSRDSAETVQRFRREMKMLASLDHPNIVIAHDAGESDGAPYLVMQFVEGEDLASIIRRHGQLSVTNALELILQAATGLEYAHEQGVIHRDLKPANLLLSRDGVVKILDVGLAKVVDTSVGGLGDGSLTASGQIMGTVDFMAPEQAEDTHQADQRSDVYSLGCTLYSLLTGRAVFDLDSVVQKILAHRDQPVRSLSEQRPDVSPELDAVIQKMVAKRPEDRYASMTQVIQALRACLPADDPNRNLVGKTAGSDARLAARGQTTAEAGPFKTTLLGEKSIVVPGDQPREPEVDTDKSLQRTISLGGQRAESGEGTESGLSGESGLKAPPPQPSSTSSHRHLRRSRRRRRQRRRILTTVGVAAIAVLTMLALMLASDSFDLLGLRPRLGLSEARQPYVGEQSDFAELQSAGLQVGGSDTNSLALSADGKRFVFGSGKDVKSWQLSSRSDLFADPAEIGHISSVVFSPRGEWFAATGAGGFQTWYSLAGQTYRKLTHAEAPVLALAFSPDETVLVVARRHLELWDVADGTKRESPLKGHQDDVVDLAFSHDGRMLASASHDGAAIVWDMTEAKPLTSLEHNSEVHVVIFDPKGGLLATGDDLGIIRLWETNDWKLRKKWQSHKAGIISLEFLTDGGRMISAATDGTIRAWEIAATEPQEIFDYQIDNLVDVTVDRQGRILAAIDKGGSLRVWNIRPQE